MTIVDGFSQVDMSASSFNVKHSLSSYFSVTIVSSSTRQNKLKCLMFVCITFFFRQSLSSSFYSRKISGESTKLTRVSCHWQQRFYSSPTVGCCWPKVFPVFASCDRQCRRSRRSDRTAPRKTPCIRKVCTASTVETRNQFEVH